MQKKLMKTKEIFSTAQKLTTQTPLRLLLIILLSLSTLLLFLSLRVSLCVFVFDFLCSPSELVSVLNWYCDCISIVTARSEINGSILYRSFKEIPGNVEGLVFLVRVFWWVMWCFPFYSFWCFKLTCQIFIGGGKTLVLFYVQ